MARVIKAAVDTISIPSAPRQNKALSVAVVLAVLLCLAVGIAGYFYYQYKHTASANEAKEIAALIKTIGTFMELPVEEIPTLATVTDKTKLAGQPFFQKAENGDKVLIYTDSGRAILYRPSTKKIVDVTTVNVKAPEEEAVTAPTATPTPETAAPPAPAVGNAPVITTTPTIALYNGSTKIGVTNTLEDEIKVKFPDMEVVAKEKATKNDYQGNLVIDFSGKYADFAKRLADNFGGTVSTLPDGETAPVVDILIIVGNK